MQYYRCKCGKSQSWGSMAPPLCEGCGECHTTLEQFPSLHREPAAHEFETLYDEHTGEPYQRCTRCLKKKDA